MNVENLTPVEKASSFHAVIRRFEELIQTGEVKPGERLPPENELAKALQVSRGTLREALKALNFVGFLVSRTGDGTYVSEGNQDLFKNAIYFSALSRQVDFLSLIEARIAIEPFLAEAAAQRATPEELNRMKYCLAHMATGLGNLKKYLTFEMAFHDEIMKAARNSALKLIMESFRDLLLEGRESITADQTDRKSLGFHTRIFEAIQKRDPKLARRRMLEHLRDSQEQYIAFYRDLKITNVIRDGARPPVRTPARSHEVRAARGLDKYKQP